VLSETLSRRRFYRPHNCGRNCRPRLESLEDRCLLSYSVTDLGTFPWGDWSRANAVNDSDQVTGSSGTEVNFHAFFWDAGTMTDLGTLGGPTSVGNAINNSGEVAGTSDINHDHNHAFLWKDGTMIDLGTLGGLDSWALGINDDGQVVGASYLNPFDYYRFHAFLWTPDQPQGTTGHMVDLGTLLGQAGEQSEAAAINDPTPTDPGQIVGWSSIDIHGGQHAVVWNSSGISDLGTLGGETSDAAALNDQVGPVVVGQADIPPPPTGQHHALHWGGLGPPDLGTLPGYTDSRAEGVSTPTPDQPIVRIVGRAEIGNEYFRAFSYDLPDGPMIDLNTQITSSDWYLQDARSININLHIAGNGAIASLNQAHGFLLVPADGPGGSPGIPPGRTAAVRDPGLLRVLGSEPGQDAPVVLGSAPAGNPAPANRSDQLLPRAGADSTETRTFQDLPLPRHPAEPAQTPLLDPLGAAETLAQWWGF
jgi:probable HAF family extracellular repeat protein